MVRWELHRRKPTTPKFAYCSWQSAVWNTCGRATRAKLSKALLQAAQEGVHVAARGAQRSRERQVVVRVCVAMRAIARKAVPSHLRDRGVVLRW